MMRGYNICLYMIVLIINGLLFGCDSNSNKKTTSASGPKQVEGDKMVLFFDPALKNVDSDTQAVTPWNFIEWVRDEIHNNFQFPGMRISSFYMSDKSYLFLCGMGGTRGDDEYWLVFSIVHNNIADFDGENLSSLNVRLDNGFPIPVMTHYTVEMPAGIADTLSAINKDISDKTLSFLSIKIPLNVIEENGFKIWVEWDDVRDVLYISPEVIKEMRIDSES